MEHKTFPKFSQGHVSFRITALHFDLTQNYQ